MNKNYLKIIAKNLSSHDICVEQYLFGILFNNVKSSHLTLVCFYFAV